MLAPQALDRRKNTGSGVCTLEASRSLGANPPLHSSGRSRKNTAARGGSGIYQDNPYNSNSPSTTVTNSTISGNNAYSGGGLANFKDLITIMNSTITNNTVTSPSGFGSGVASAGNTSTETEVFSSIVSANSPDNNDVNLVEGNTNSFKSDGYNLIGGGLSTAFNQPTDRSNVTNPGLSSLANNGGLTHTHALKKCSPAINKSTNTGCPATDQPPPSCLSTDVTTLQSLLLAHCPYKREQHFWPSV
jgi:hypothetical protein